MRSEIVGSSEERPTVNEVRGFLIFLASRISHSICASKVLSYAERCKVEKIVYDISFIKHFIALTPSYMLQNASH
jgi:hypothetical protein